MLPESSGTPAVLVTGATGYSGVVVHQTAVFEPVGLPGLLYWYVRLPVHGLTFGGLLRAIARRALRQPLSPVA